MSSSSIGRFIAALKFEDLPVDVVAKCKLAILDTIGVALAGFDDPASVAARRMVKEAGGAGESTVLGDSLKGPCNVVAFANAVTASTLDMDDGLYGPEGHLCHPACMVVTGALAVAEREKAGGKHLVEACVAGFELAVRAGATYARYQFEAMAGVGGSFGAAAASAKALGLDAERVTHALEITEAHCPQPLSRALDNDPHMKRSREQVYYCHAPMTKENCGWAAMTGVSAALLAKSGFYGPSTIFDIVEDKRRPVTRLGEQWEILKTYFKPYSICRGLHSAIDGVLALAREHNIRAGDVAAVTVGVSKVLSLFSNARPVSRYEAQTSFPFAVAAALIYGEVGPEQIAWDKLKDTAMLALADKVKVTVSPAAEALSPGMDSAEVEIETKTGGKFRTWVEYPLGQPENPLKREDIVAKFMKNSAAKLGAAKAEKLSRFVDDIESCRDIHGLMALIN
jgi:2-methylcitrate dehydratase PrpD